MRPSSGPATPATWDPRQYSCYEAERDRPVFDLLMRVSADHRPAEVWDLGCGTGAHAALMARRWPLASVHGLDSSPDMIAAARARPEPVAWSLGDVSAWAPERPVDLILANASLQWAPNHPGLFPHLMTVLAPDGVLLVQMPLGYDTPHHRALREVTVQGDWAEALAGVPRLEPLLSPGDYYDLLTADGAETVDIWSTTYLHVLEGEAPVLEWMRGTALRPYLTALASAPDLRTAFETALQARLSEAYPRRADGRTLLPFPRLFLTARAPGPNAVV